MITNTEEIKRILRSPTVDRLFMNSNAYDEMLSMSKRSLVTRKETGGKLFGWPCVVEGTRRVIPWVVLVTQCEEKSTSVTLTIDNSGDDIARIEYNFGHPDDPEAITLAGTWHSHPPGKLFLSETDYNNFEKMKMPWQTQLVLDPFHETIAGYIRNGSTKKEIDVVVYTGRNWKEWIV